MPRRLVCNFEHIVVEDDEFELNESALPGDKLYWCPLVRDWLLERCKGPTCESCKEFFKQRA